MTTQELNRDIKRLYKIWDKALDSTHDPKKVNDYYKQVTKEFMPEFRRLYYASDDFSMLNKNSILMLFKLNQSHRVIALHSFGYKIKIN